MGKKGLRIQSDVTWRPGGVGNQPDLLYTQYVPSNMITRWAATAPIPKPYFFQISYENKGKFDSQPL